MFECCLCIRHLGGQHDVSKLKSHQARVYAAGKPDPWSFDGVLGECPFLPSPVDLSLMEHTRPTPKELWFLQLVNQ